MPTDFRAGQLRAALQTKTDVLKSLIDLIPKETRGEALRLIEQLDDAVRFLVENSPSSIDLEIATASKTIEAIMIWLAKKTYPVTQKEIIEGVFSSGFRRPKNGTPDQQRGNISKSFGMFLGGAADDGKAIKKVGDLIGLASWETDRFRTNGNDEKSIPAEDD